MSAAALILHSVLLGLAVIIASFVVGWSVLRGAAGVAEAAAARPPAPAAALPPISITVTAPPPPPPPAEADAAGLAASTPPAAETTRAVEPLPELDFLRADERARGPGEGA